MVDLSSRFRLRNPRLRLPSRRHPYALPSLLAPNNLRCARHAAHPHRRPSDRHVSSSLPHLWPHTQSPPLLAPALTILRFLLQPALRALSLHHLPLRTRLVSARILAPNFHLRSGIRPVPIRDCKWQETLAARPRRHLCIHPSTHVRGMYTICADHGAIER